jgi:hypothetical protein
MAQASKYEGAAVVQKPLEPHPVIPEFYAERAQRLPFVRDLFNTAAPHHDTIEYPSPKTDATSSASI